MHDGGGVRVFMSFVTRLRDFSDVGTSEYELYLWVGFNEVSSGIASCTSLSLHRTQTLQKRD